MKSISYFSVSYLGALCVHMLLIASCRKEVPEINRPEDYSNFTFEQIFDGYWNGMNNNYVFWDIDTTDWDRVYQTYRPLFARLDRTNSNDVSQAQFYFRQISSGLIDGHYYIDFANNAPRIVPATNRFLQRDDLRSAIPIGHFFNTIPQRYLNPGWSRARAVLDGSENYLVTGTIEEDILYLYFSDFNVRQLYNRSDAFKQAFDAFLSNLQREAQPRGIVLDLRGNPGGSLADIHLVIGSMIEQPLHFGYTKSKANNNRLDYTPLIPATVEPRAGARAITAPVVVLADLYSGSMSEITTLAVRALPNGYFIGQTTFGAMGPLTENIFLNGGAFQTSFMSDVNTSSAQTLSLDKRSYEGKGVPPDALVPADLVAIQSGQDAQLDAALRWIKGQ